MSQSQNENRPGFWNLITYAYAIWFYKTPAVTRCIVLISIAGTVLGLIGFDNNLGDNSPLKSLMLLQFWRIFTSGFIGRNVLMDLSAVFSIYQVCAVLEPKKGSMFLLVSAIASTVLVQFVSVVLLALLAMTLTPILFFVGGGGYWPMAFVFIALESSMSTSQYRQFMCFPFEVPTKMYPFILALLFFLLSGMKSVDILVGLGLGYAFGRYPFLLPSSALCHTLELKHYFQPIVQLNGYIMFIADGDNLVTTGATIRPETQRPSSPFVAFSGIGYKLGTASDLDSEDTFLAAPVAERYIPSSAIEVPPGNNTLLGQEKQDTNEPSSLV